MLLQCALARVFEASHRRDGLCAVVPCQSLGFTALHAAADGNKMDVVSALLAAGADVNSRRKRTGETPLHLAVTSPGDDLDMVKLLLDAGADPNLANSVRLSVGGENVSAPRPGTARVSLLVANREVGVCVCAWRACAMCGVQKGQRPLELALEFRRKVYGETRPQHQHQHCCCCLSPVTRPASRPRSRLFRQPTRRRVQHYHVDDGSTKRGAVMDRTR